MSGMPSPINIGTTLMTNSSIACASRQRGDDFTAAHQPDVLALAFSKSIHEPSDCLVCEFDGRRSIFWTRMTREDDGSTLGIEICSHAQTGFVGLPAEYFRID